MRAPALAVLAVAALLALPALQPASAGQPLNLGPDPGGVGFDGSILYTLLLHVLGDIARGDYQAAARLAGSLARAPAPPGLEGLHARVYETLESLALALEEAEGYAGSGPSIPRDLALRLEDLKVKLHWLLRYYSDALEEGIADKALAREYSERLQSLLEVVDGRVDGVAGSLAAPGIGVNLGVEVEPSAVLGGGEARVHITAPGGLDCNATVSLLAGGVIVDTVPAAVSGGRGEALIRAPDAGEAERLGLAGSGGGVVNALVEVRAECSNGREGYGRAGLSITYLPPGVSARIPGRVAYGDPVVIEFNASRPANVTVRVDGEPVASLELEPPGSTIELDSRRLGVGSHTVDVAFDARGPYVGGSVRARLEVEGKPFEARVYIPGVTLSPLGTVEAGVYLGPGPGYRVEVYVDGRLKASATLAPGAHRLRIPCGDPLIPGYRDVEVRVEPLGDGYEPAAFRARVLEASPLTPALAIAASLATLALRGPGWWAPGIPGGLRAAGRAAGRGVGGYVEYLKLRIAASRVARLYRRALSLLGIPAPLPSETLREHYSRAVEAHTPEGLRGHLARLLEAAERDLYSARKPSPGEVERLVGVIRRVRRKG